MNISRSFDLNSLKEESVDSLISKCKRCVGRYLSKSEAERLDKAYEELKYDEVKLILEETLKKIKLMTENSEYQKAEKAITDVFPETEKLFNISDNNEGSQNKKMGTGNVLIVVCVVIVAILVITIISSSVYLKLKRNNISVGDVLMKRMNKDNSQGKAYRYTDKDRDMMNLIHELSTIYDNTDHYMNN